ncbi:MAG: LysM peptidoglycan-binding domain-containing protein [Phycisphaerae bacterium]|nr:LysM peptidoglycan-binding domain-containing protein [Phycisphaerae bacterium]
MRSDIKVGMAIAVILIGIGVVWIVFFRSGGPSEGPAPGTDDAGVAGKTDDTNVVVTTPSETTLPLLQTEPLIRPPYTPPPATTTRPTGVAVTPAVAGVRPDEWTGVPVRPALTATESTTPFTVRPAVATARTYVIKEGDSYWTIAHNLWGDGSLYPHLQKANPGVSPDDLRPRMTIKVPSKPLRVSSASTTAAIAAVRHGTTSVDLLTGKRYYIVKKGDRGFWDISKAVYRDGKYYGLIEKANPKLDSRKLRPGQKVWCPDKPVRPAGVAVTPAGTEPAYVGPTTTAPAAAVAGGAAAPTRTTLPDGRIFD